MKKIIVLFLLLMTSYSFAADGTHIFTNELRNGYSFTDEEWAHPYNQHGYIDGLIDGLKYAKLININTSRLEAFETLKNFYLKNPAQKQTPIIEILIERFK